MTNFPIAPIVFFVCKERMPSRLHNSKIIECKCPITHKNCTKFSIYKISSQTRSVDEAHCCLESEVL